MPPVLGPIVAAVATGLGVSTATASIIVGFAFSAIITAATSLLAGKPKIPSGLIGGTDNTLLNITEAIAPRQIIYGRRRVGGVRVFIDVSSNSNEFLHILLAVAGHPVEAIDEIFFDGELVDLDANGDAATGSKYEGLVTIKKGLGTTAGDSDLLTTMQADVPTKWTSSHKVEGVAKIYAKIKFNRDTFSKVPDITAFVRGKKCFDPRDSQTRYTTNPALCLRDYLTDTNIGFSESTGNIDDTQWSAEANTCEESVTLLGQSDTFTVDDTTDLITLDTDPVAISALEVGNGVQLTTTGTLPAPLATATTYYWIPIKKGVGKLATTKANALSSAAVNITNTGSGVHTLERQSELRYSCNGVMTSDLSHKDIISRILTSCAGRLVWQSGNWTLYVGAYRTPVISYNEADTLEPLEIQTLRSKRDLINRVRGTYADPDSNFQPTDFPIVTNTTYFNDDLFDELWLDMDLPFTTSSIAAQRLGKIELEKIRQQIRFKLTTGLKGLRNKAGDTISYSNSRMGWVNKPFEIIEWEGLELKEIGEDILPIVKMTLQETAPTIYDWAQGEETKVDPSPDTNLPDPNNVQPPSNLMLSSGTAQLLTNSDGTLVSRILASWTASPDFFVDNYEIEFKKSTDSNWSSTKISFNQTEILIDNVQDGINYDVRVRAKNVTGAASAWIQELGHTVIGKSEKPTEPDTFAVIENPDGARKFSWTHAAAEPDVRSGGGYKIRYFLGTTSNWAAMTDLHEFKLVNSPYLSTELAAGTYTFAIKTVDSTGNESTNAVFISNVVLGNPPILNAIVSRNEQAEGWDGERTDCFLTNQNILEAKSSQAWSDLAATWDALADTWKGILTNHSPIVYTTPVIDLGADFNIKPLVNLVVDGTATVAMKTGTNADGAALFASDLVSNGDFATDLTGWTDGDTGTGASTWISGEMDLNAGASGQAKRYQTISGLTIGNVYQVTFDVKTANVGVTIDGDTEGDGAHVARAVYVPGNYHQITFVAAETSATLVFDTTSGGTAQVDNVAFGEFVAIDLVTARYVQVQIAVTGSTPRILSMLTIIDSPAAIENYEDIDTSAGSSGTYESVGTGHFKILTKGNIDRITQASVKAIQGTGSAGYTATLIDKNAGFGGLLLLNWDFATDLSNWTDNDTGTGVSSWTSPGYMRLNGGSSGNAARYQAASSLTIGRRYQLRFTVITNPVNMKIDGDTVGDGAHHPLTNYAVGTHLVEFIAVETTATVTFSNDQNNNGDIDGVILRDGRAAAEFQIYNASQAAANAIVDIELKGARV